MPPGAVTHGQQGDGTLVLQSRTLPAAERLLEMQRHGESDILPPGAGHHLHANRQPLW